MIPMQTRISEPLPFSLLKAFCSFFLISLYVDDNYICIPISVELYITVSYFFGLQAELAQHLLHEAVSPGASLAHT